MQNKNDPQLPTASIVTDDSAADADQVTAITPPAPTPARADDETAQPAQVYDWHEARRRHRAKADSVGRVALAVDYRIEASGFWIAFHLRELIRALHVTPDHERIAGLLGWPLERVKNDMTTLYVLGLVDADGALDGPLVLRKLIRVTPGHYSPIVAAFIEARRQPKRMKA